MTTRPTEADLAQAEFAKNPITGCRAVAHSDRGNQEDRWVVDCSDVKYSDAEMALNGWVPVLTTPTIPEWGDIPEDVQEAMVERASHQLAKVILPLAYAEHPEDIAKMYLHRTRGTLAAALTSPPTRPEWADAPAVLAETRLDSPDGYRGERVFVASGFEDDRMWDASNERHYDPSDLINVTPLYPEGLAPEVEK